MINIEKLNTDIELNPFDKVTYTQAGNVVEVRYMSNKNNQATIKMLGNKSYLVCSTGEVKEFENKSTNRTQNKQNLYRTFNLIRGIINSNTEHLERVRWITLTYAENMTDTNLLYKDFEKFNKRFQYWSKKNGFGKIEYIVVAEPQGRGAWHMHLLYIFNEILVAPFVPNNVLAEIWGHGFVTVKKLDDNVDNLGTYLTAYLGDVELNFDGDNFSIGDLDLIDCLNLQQFNGGNLGEIKEIDIEVDGEMVKKKFLKGARLSLYPAKFNIIRTSRGIKRPKVEEIYHHEAEKKVNAATLTFKKTVKLSDTDSNFNSVISYKYYNLFR